MVRRRGQVVRRQGQVLAAARAGAAGAAATATAAATAAAAASAGGAGRGRTTIIIAIMNETEGAGDGTSGVNTRTHEQPHSPVSAITNACSCAAGELSGPIANECVASATKNALKNHPGTSSASDHHHHHQPPVQARAEPRTPSRERAHPRNGHDGGGVVSVEAPGAIPKATVPTYADISANVTLTPAAGTKRSSERQQRLEKYRY